MFRNRLPTILTRPTFLLALLLVVFFSKGVFLTVIQPIFTGQDEARHYNSIQLIITPSPIPPEESRLPIERQDKDDLSTYRFSEEIRETARATNNHLLRADDFNTMRFSDTSVGLQESRVDAKPWPTNNLYYPPDAVRSSILYHQLASVIEQVFSDESIFTRFYLIRIFSALLGTLAILLAYLTARTIGFSSTTSLITTALIVFQPKFSLYSSQINYDTLLIPLFFLFTYATARVVRDGFTPTNLILLVGTIVPAILTKATGSLLSVVLLALILSWAYPRFTKLHSRRLRAGLIGLLLFVSLGSLVFLYQHFFGAENSLAQKLSSLPTYLSKTLTWNKVVWPSETYWGMLGWTNSGVIQYTTTLIFILEWAAIAGLVLLFFAQRLKESYPSFLPAKKQLLFLAIMMAVLQIGVRFADWNIYVSLDEKMSMSLGTPGRYFLPALLAHILLITSGLGALLAYFKQERYFNPILLGLLILMTGLMLHTIFNVIIFRYYF